MCRTLAPVQSKLVNHSFIHLPYCCYCLIGVSSLDLGPPQKRPVFFDPLARDVSGRSQLERADEEPIGFGG